MNVASQLLERRSGHSDCRSAPTDLLSAANGVPGRRQRIQVVDPSTGR